MDTANEIIYRIRSQTQFILDFTQTKLKQPDPSSQHDIIERLIAANVFIDVIAKSGVLVENECPSGHFENDSLFAKTSYFRHAAYVFDELKENKTILFYFWGAMPLGKYEKLRYVRSSSVVHPLKRYRKE